MQMKTWALTMGVGAAVGAMAVSLLPRQSKAKKMVDQAAKKVETAAETAVDKMVGSM